MNLICIIDAKQQGKVLMKAQLVGPELPTPTTSGPAKQQSATVPPSSTSGSSTVNLKLILSALEVKELVNTGNVLDGQDPALAITIGSTTYTTDR